MYTFDHCWSMICLYNRVALGDATEKDRTRWNALPGERKRLWEEAWQEMWMTDEAMEAGTAVIGPEEATQRALKTLGLSTD